MGSKMKAITTIGTRKRTRARAGKHLDLETAFLVELAGKYAYWKILNREFADAYKILLNKFSNMADIKENS